MRNLRDPYSTDSDSSASLPITAAPLVFAIDDPSLENEENTEGGKPGSAGGKVKKAYARFERYLDRRAQAQYVRNPKSLLPLESLH